MRINIYMNMHMHVHSHMRVGVQWCLSWVVAARFCHHEDSGSEEPVVWVFTVHKGFRLGEECVGASSQETLHEYLASLSQQERDRWNVWGSTSQAAAG